MRSIGWDKPLGFGKESVSVVKQTSKSRQLIRAVAHVCNPSYSGGSLFKKFKRLHLNRKN
jgi:hypothetical protein